MVRRRSSRKKKGSGAGPLILLLVMLGLGGVAAWYFFLPVGPASETFVEIAPGSTTSQIASQLEVAGVIRSQYAFELVRLWKRGKLKAGEYRFDHSAAVTEVYARIARGDVYTISVTLPEGSNRFDVADRLERAGLVPKEDFLAATVSEVRLISDFAPHAATVEGYLFPDTYRFPRKATAPQIVAAMVKRFRSKTEPLGLGRNAQDVVTLASLVEKETAVEEERPLVASVLSNRLAKKIPLMTDPAVIYGLKSADKWRGAIYESDLKDPTHDTPYNTYHHNGLPPGPVANPGLPSLRAAMNPAATEYLYFVAAGNDPRGKSRFAITLDEHNKNVASYRQAVKQAGGR